MAGGKDVIRMARMIALTAFVVLGVTSCRNGKNPMLARSGGAPFEVLVVCSDSLWNSTSGRALYNILDADVEGLPQPESQFKISHASPDNYNQITRLARNIVIVSADASLYTSTKVRYEKNVYAQPQMIVYVNTPSGHTMLRDMNKIGNTVTTLLNRAEINAEIDVLGDRHHIKYGQLIKRMFDVNLWIPADMRSIKKGKDFVWISDNATSGMRSICIYSYPMDGKMTQRQIMEKRDSVMRRNIPGETDGMYMHTVAASVKCKLTKENGHRIYIARGLWEMTGDAMGGPFVSHSVVDSAHRRIIVAEGFVYAPEMKKRNKIRMLEAALYTLNK